MRIPDPVLGSNRMAGWLNKLRQFIQMNVVVDSADIRVSRTTHGTVLQLASAGAGGSTIRQLRLHEIKGDYLVCRTWDGTTAGTTDVYVARVYQHRQSVFDGKAISYSSDGDVYTASYAYSSPTKRVSTISGQTPETQVLIPHHKIDFDIIYAATVSGLNVSTVPVAPASAIPISLLDLNVDGRAWAKL